MVAQRIHRLKEEVNILRQALLDQDYGYDNVRTRIVSSMTPSFSMMHKN